jgi:uncharacterized protein YceK
LREKKKAILEESEMKKIAGKIAMILILILAVNTFTSCFTAWAFTEVYKERGGAALAILLLPFCLVLDVLTWPFQLIALAAAAGSKSRSDSRSAYEISALTEEECALLTAKTASLPEEDGEFLIAAIASLPGTERAGALEQLNSVPERQFASLVRVMRALYALPQDDRVLLVEELRSLPEEEKAYLTETGNSLTDEERAALVDEIISLPAKEMSRQIEILRETPSSDWGYREYAAERFAGR